MRSAMRGGSTKKWQRTVLAEPTPSASHDYIDELLAQSFVHAEDWKQLSPAVQNDMLACADRRQILALMVEHRLLTDYQASRIAAGTTFGLGLGNYRSVDR